MYKAIVVGLFGLLLLSTNAMALCTSYPYTITNGTSTDASQVMANFNCAALTSGSTLNNTTLTGTTTFPSGSTLNGVTLSGATTIPGGVIDSSGNVGIGTATPSSALTVSSGKITSTASSSSSASINLPPGTAPSSPANGDCWITSAGLYCQINGATVGPMGPGGSGGSVTTSGSPASGNLTQFSGSSTITKGDLSGACTTSGTLVVTCPNAVYSNANQSFTKAQRSTPASLTISTSTFTPNFDNGQNFNITLVHASCPCTLANPSTTPVAGQTGIIEITQSSSGADTIGTWGSDYTAAGGSGSIVLSTGANARDYFSYYVDDSTHIVLSAGLLNASH